MRPEYKITVQCFDHKGQASPLESGEFTLEYQLETVPQVNIIMSVTTIKENLPLGTVIGRYSKVVSCKATQHNTRKKKGNPI